MGSYRILLFLLFFALFLPWGYSYDLLSAKDTGLYGPASWEKTGSNPGPGEFYSRVAPLTFTIRTSVNANKAILDNATRLKNLNDVVGNVAKEIDAGNALIPKRKILLRVYFWNSLQEQVGEYTNLSSTQEYQNSVNHILDKLGQDKVDLLYGITLGEENWVETNPAIARVLDDLYAGTKARYPNLQIYQWYDYRLSERNAVPETYGGVFTRADGWVVEELRLSKETCPDSKCKAGDDPYRRILQKYLITGKPIVTEIWAATSRPDQFNFKTPGAPPYPINMFNLMAHQFDTNVEFNLPTAFYWYACAKGTSAPCIPRQGGQQTAFFETTYPGYFPNSGDFNIQKMMNEQVAKYIQKAQALPSVYSGLDSQQQWSEDAIAMPCTEGAPVYSDDFSRNNLVDVTSGSGFRQLVWKPGFLSVRSFNSKPINASITYHFVCDIPVSQATAKATFTLSTQGTVFLEVSKDGNSWWKGASSNSGVLSVNLGGSSARKDIYLRVRMSSQDTNPNHLPITLKKIEIGPRTGSLQPRIPSEKDAGSLENTFHAIGFVIFDWLKELEDLFKGD